MCVLEKSLLIYLKILVIVNMMKNSQHTTCAEDVFLGKWCIRGDAR